MAELLGTVASAIAVAEVGFKVGGTVYKLRQLWKEVQEVPEKIQDLMEQIDIYEPLLADIERNFAVGPLTGSDPGPGIPQDFATSIGRNGAPYCREALQNLQQLVQELSNKINLAKTRRHRTFAKVQVLLKKEDLKGFQSRLKRAQWLLQASQMGYLTSLAKSQNQLVVQISQQVTMISANSLSPANPSQPIAAPITAQTQRIVTKTSATQKRAHRLLRTWSRPSYFGSFVFGPFKEDGTASGLTWMARFQPPTWLSQKAWEVLYTQRAYSGWQINLTSFNLVPQDSLVMQFVEHDNWPGICELFREGRATPYDYNEYGWTIFEFACLSASSTVISGLIRTGQTVSNVSGSLNVFHFFATYARKDSSTLLDGMQSLLNAGFLEWAADDTVDLDPADVGSDSYCYTFLNLAFTPPIEGLFERQLKLYMPNWDHLRPSVKSKLGLRATESCGWQANHARRLVRPHGPIREDDMRHWKEDGVSLLHWIVYNFSLSKSRAPWCAFKETLADWQQFLRETITAAGTSSLHYLHPYNFEHSSWPPGKDRSPGTFLSCFFSGAMSGTHNGLRQMEIEKKLQVLVGVLKSCGVDLEAYGRKEFDMWESEYGGATHMVTGSCVNITKWNWSRQRWTFWRPQRLDKWIHIGHFDLLSAIYYGPEPDDWAIEWDRYRDYSQVFWKLVENPLQVEIMPGSWVDDDLYEDSDMDSH